ncbi:MAG: hypothetical protein ACKOOG_09020, partial [Actinomycetota bacterium]
MLANQARRFGEVLVDRHVLSRDDLESAIGEADRTGQPLPAVLLRQGLVGAKDLTAALAEQLGVRFVDFTDVSLHQDAPTFLTAETARRLGAVPIDFEGNKLVVAFAQPADDATLEAVGRATSFEIIPAVADRTELEQALDTIYGPAAGTPAPTAGDEGFGLHVNDLLALVVDWGGSDLHLTSGSPPVIRVHGDLRAVPDAPVLNGSEVRRLVFAMLTKRQREKFEAELELDTSYALPGVGRFRVNVFLQRDSVGCVMRVIPYEIVPFDSLGVPPVVRSWAYLPRGLVLITGPTGSGKSTTLASLLD